MAIDQLEVFFNVLFNAGKFPCSWNLGTLTPIFKKGDPNECKNYRTITVGSILGKLYCSILERRLQIWSEKNRKRARGQAGSRIGYRTLDHIFLLREVIHKTTSKGGGLFACFVDFSKAFDNVSRDKLWARLHTIGVSVRFLNAIKSTYEKVQCAVSTPHGLTNYFTSLAGVKQGCPLSPLLFGLYVDKLEVMLMRNKASKPTLEDTAIPFLGYVDDLVILSLDEEGMQRCLRTLEKFCKETELEVNLEKTKIMHFGRKRRILEAPTLKFKGAQVEIVKQYTYLGIPFGGKGRKILGEAQATVAKKGERASLALQRRCSELGIGHPHLKLQLFNAVVKPILLYGSEIWGIGEKINEIEKVFTTFLRRILGVRRSTPTSFLWRETGEMPLRVTILKQAMKYLARMKELRSERILAKAWGECNKQATNLEGWKFEVMSEVRRITQGIVEINEEKKLEITQVMKTMKQTIWSAWQQEETSKSKWYNSLKKAEGMEKYLTSIPNPTLRNCLTRFRLGSHWLEVEKGRWQGKQREDQTCETCLKMGRAQVEDEEHMMKICPLYEEVRREFADLEFDRNVEEIVQDNCVSLVARFVTRCEAICTRNILAV